MINIALPRWAKEMEASTARYFFLKGGRGGTKTETVYGEIVIEMVKVPNLKVIGLRYIQSNISESSKSTVLSLIDRFGLQDYFYFSPNTSSYIRCKNGSYIYFRGIYKQGKMIKGLNDYHAAVLDEANEVPEEKIFIDLFPTIRADAPYYLRQRPGIKSLFASGSKLFFCWNPYAETDPIDVLFNKRKGSPYVFTKHLTYKDNPYMPQSLKIELEIDRKTAEESGDWDHFNHVWLGDYAKIDNENIVLPLNKLRRCVGLDLPLTGYPYAGGDVANGGTDNSSIGVRVNNTVTSVTEANIKGSSKVAQWMRVIAEQHSVVRLYLDVVGLGAGVEDVFNVRDASEMLPFVVQPFMGGGRVYAGEQPFFKASQKRYTITNAQMFSNLNAQAWWNMRQRLENTMRFLDGNPVDESRLLALPANTPTKILKQLSQVQFDAEKEKDIKIIKKPDGMPSPDCADCIVMSFTRDLKRGLRYA